MALVECQDKGHGDSRVVGVKEVQLTQEFSFPIAAHKSVQALGESLPIYSWKQDYVCTCLNYYFFLLQFFTLINGGY